MLFKIVVLSSLFCWPRRTSCPWGWLSAKICWVSRISWRVILKKAKGVLSMYMYMYIFWFRPWPINPLSLVSTPVKHSSYMYMYMYKVCDRCTCIVPKLCTLQCIFGEICCHVLSRLLLALPTPLALYNVLYTGWSMSCVSSCSMQRKTLRWKERLFKSKAVIWRRKSNVKEVLNKISRYMYVSTMYMYIG